ncbi:TOBE domain-containing protein [Desulfovibrio aminophilus]|uniref:TOBE domain-containing protein n=1 Tax=Desulfovibrio aminophilus TaxID=81425 RepID=UPI00041F9BBD|nr:TOBE domain-containing protein [Desulfovibrio aminophilus]
MKSRQPPPDQENGRLNPSAVFAVPEGVKYLDTIDLARLTEAFAKWAEQSRRADTRRSRLRLWLIYLLLRHTGARLGEVLALDDAEDLDPVAGVVRFRGRKATREVRLSDEAASELRRLLADPALLPLRGTLCHMDQGHIRRKFQERSRAAGIPLELANPTVLRRSRAIELLRGDMPLKVVQDMLGQSSADLTAAFLDFSEEDKKRITEHILERESRRKTSARNAFFGKVARVIQGDIQARVELSTLGGHAISSVITVDSVQSLGIRPGMLLTAEIKAPWVLVETCGTEPRSSAENRLQGVIDRVTVGKLTAEVIVRLADDTRVCSVTTAESAQRLELCAGNPAWVTFSAYSVILKVD